MLRLSFIYLIICISQCLQNFLEFSSLFIILHVVYAIPRLIHLAYSIAKEESPFTKLKSQIILMTENDEKFLSMH